MLSALLVVGVVEAVQFAGAPHAARARADVATGTAGMFVPVTGRLLDTRNGTGGYSTPMPANATRSVQALGVAGLPSSGVSALALTLTVVNPGSLGGVSVAAGDTTPNAAVAALVFNAGDSVSNTAMVAVHADGRINLRADHAVNLIVDVQGYFTTGSSTADGGFVAVTPTKLADTRSGTGVAQAKVSNGGTVTVQATGAAGVPATATSVYVNVTALNQAGNGYVRAYAAGAAVPSTNALDFVGVTTAQSVAVPLSADGRFSLTVGAGGPVDLLVDVQGYFDGTTTTGAFTPAAVHLFDSRATTAIAANSVATVQVAGIKGIPVVGSGIGALALNLRTVNSGTGSGYLRVWPSTGTEPSTSMVNYVSGDTYRTNLAVIAPGSDGSVKVRNVGSGPIDVVIDVQGWFSTVTSPLPANQSRTQENVTLQANGAASGNYVTYQYRVGTTGAFGNVPVADVTVPGTTTHPSGWPVSRPAGGLFDSYIWDLGATVNHGDQLVQVQACFGSGASDPSPVCSMPSNVQLATHAFGDSYATTDVGPGTLAELTGDYQVSATDFSVPSYRGTLSIGRTFTTLAPAGERADATGVFGPGWTASLPGSDVGAADLTLSDNPAGAGNPGYLTFTGDDGDVAIYQATSPTTTYPISYAGVDDAAADGDTVVRTSATAVTMTDEDGVTTTFARTGSGSSAVWGVTSVTEAASNSATSFTRDAAGRVTRILGAVPSGIACTAPDTTAGCRSLTFAYTTTAPTRLVSVFFHAWDPQAAKMTSVEVAHYDYDASNRLADSYDPRVSPNLKTAYTYDGQGRLVTVTPPGLAAWALSYDARGRLSTASRPDATLNQNAVTTVVYGVPTTGTGAPIDLGATAAAGWGQTDLPAGATAVFGPDRQPAGTAASTVTAADWPFASIDYFDVNGRTTNSASYGAGGWQYGATAHDANGNTVSELTAGNRVQALNPTADTDPAVTATTSSADRAGLLSSTTSYDPVNPASVTDTYGPLHPTVLVDGSTVDARSHTHTSYDEGAPADASGNPVSYGLPTTASSGPLTLDGADHSADTVTTHTGYDAVTSGDPTGWSLRLPTSTTTQLGAAPSAADLVRISRYNTDGAIVETRLPAGQSGGTAASTVTAYYTATGTGSCISASLAGLTCSVGPAAQPASGNPLPVTSTTYNLYDQPLVVTETAGTTVRTTTTTYDNAGRTLMTATAVAPTAAGGTALPVVTTAYSTSTGLPTTVSAGGKTLTTGYDSLGRTVSYTDASGTVSSTSYDISGQAVAVNDGKATTAYTYDSATEHRGLVTAEDVGAGTALSGFSATYDADGNLVSQTYPNGLTSTKRFDNTGNDISLGYTKNSSTWLTFTQTADAQGRTVRQSSPASSQTFGYDPAGRLILTRDTVAAVGMTPATCTTRAYTLDKNSNRTQLQAYPAASGGVCSTSTTPTTTISSFDAADRITNAGYAYDTLGRTTTVPAGDAVGIGSHATLTGALGVGYYANDLVASQTQGGTTQTFTLDPLQNRVLSSATGATTTTSHYADGGDSPAWTSTSASVWTRNLTGIDGGLVGTIDQTGTLTLDLANLHGDIVATAADTSSAAAVSSYSESTEFGAPRNASAAPDTYGWLGAKKRSTNDLGGLTLMGVRLYNPATGRFLSVDPVPGGSDNPYVYVNDPTDQYDLDGNCWRWCHRAWQWGRHHWNDIAVGAACTFAGPLGCAVASGVNMAYKWRTHQYHHWSDVAFDGASALGGWGAGRIISRGWRARNFAYSTVRRARWGGAHRAAVAWGRTVSNWGKNAGVTAASFGVSYAWSHRRRWSY